MFQISFSIRKYFLSGFNSRYFIEKQKKNINFNNNNDDDQESKYRNHEKKNSVALHCN